MIKNNQIKKLVCYSILTLLLCSFQSKAQDDGGSIFSLKYGIKGGANLSSLTSAYFGLPNSRLGYQVGGFVAYKLNNLVSFELEAMYANFGSSLIDPAKLYVNTVPGSSSIVKSKVRLNAIEIPLLVNIYLTDMSGGSKAKLFFGPEINYYISATAINTTMEGNVSATSTTDVSASFQTTDFAGIVGVGIENKNISIDLRYRAGIAPVNYIRSSAFKDFGLNALSFNVGFSF